MRKLRSSFVQGLFGQLALRHVLKSADEQGTTSALPRETRQAAQVLHGTSRGNNPKHKVDVFARHAARNHGVKRRQVLGMDGVPNRLRRDLGCRIKLEDAEGLLRPIVVIRENIGDEAARLAQALGFGKTKIGLLDLRLRPFPIVDVSIYS